MAQKGNLIFGLKLELLNLYDFSIQQKKNPKKNVVVGLLWSSWFWLCCLLVELLFGRVVVWSFHLVGDPTFGLWTLFLLRDEVEERK
jgi:hypothetical protein